MTDLLHLSTTTIKLSSIVFIDWMATRDYGYCKTGVKIQCTIGELFLLSNSIYHEEDVEKLALATQRISVDDVGEETIRILTKD